MVPRGELMLLFLSIRLTGNWTLIITRGEVGGRTDENRGKGLRVYLSWWALSNIQNCLITILYTWNSLTLYVNYTGLSKKKNRVQGTWVAQSLKCPALDFTQVMISQFSLWDPALHQTPCCQGGVCLGFSLFLSLCPSPICMCAPALSQNTNKH